jgi:hypothetical protein
VYLSKACVSESAAVREGTNSLQSVVVIAAHERQAFEITVEPDLDLLGGNIDVGIGLGPIMRNNFPSPLENDASVSSMPESIKHGHDLPFIVASTELVVDDGSQDAAQEHVPVGIQNGVPRVSDTCKYADA